MLIEEIDGQQPTAHPFGVHLIASGFVAGAMGFQAKPERVRESGESSPSRR